MHTNNVSDLSAIITDKNKKVRTNDIIKSFIFFFINNRLLQLVQKDEKKDLPLYHLIVKQSKVWLMIMHPKNELRMLLQNMLVNQYVLM